jgi:hypothetical protein
MEANKLNVGEEWFKTITQLTLSYQRNLDSKVELSNLFNESLTLPNSEEVLVQKNGKQFVKTVI